MDLDNILQDQEEMNKEIESILVSTGSIVIRDSIFKFCK